MRRAIMAAGVAAAFVFSAGQAQASNACQIPGNQQALFQEIDRGLNQIRRQNGLRGLRYNAELSQAATNHACDMAVRGYFSHTGRNGSTVQRRARSAGYRDCLIAENIAHGTPYAAPSAVLNGWMNSEGHRFNMMLDRVQDYGIGIAVDHNGPYWVLVLAKGC